MQPASQPRNVEYRSRMDFVLRKTNELFRETRESVRDPRVEGFIGLGDFGYGICTGMACWSYPFAAVANFVRSFSALEETESGYREK